MLSPIGLLVLSVVPALSIPQNHVSRQSPSSVCGSRGFDLATKAYFYEASEVLATQPACGVKCFADSKCHSYAVGGGACILYKVPVTGNLNPVKESLYEFYDKACQASTICDVPGFDLNSPTAFANSTAANALTTSGCGTLCQKTTGCQSYASSDEICYLYKAPTKGNVDAVSSSPNKFFDLGCDPAVSSHASSSVVSISSTTSPSSSSKSSSTQDSSGVSSASVSLSISSASSSVSSVNPSSTSTWSMTTSSASPSTTTSPGVKKCPSTSYFNIGVVFNGTYKGNSQLGAGGIVGLNPLNNLVAGSSSATKYTFDSAGSLVTLGDPTIKAIAELYTYGTVWFGTAAQLAQRKATGRDIEFAICWRDTTKTPNTILCRQEGKTATQLSMKYWILYIGPDRQDTKYSYYVTFTIENEVCT